MKKLVLFSIIALLFIPSLSLAQQKAKLYFSPLSDSYSVGQKINVSVVADPQGETFDTVRAVVKFPADLLAVQNVGLNPIFSVADPESRYDNTGGTVSWAAGIPGGTNKLSQFITITFSIKKAGEASLLLDSQSLVLSGGTNVLQGLGSPLKFSAWEKTVQPSSQTVQQTVFSPPESATSSQDNLAPVQNESNKENSVGLAALSAGQVPIVNRGYAENFQFAGPLYLFLAVSLLAALVYYKKTILSSLKKRFWALMEHEI